MKYWAVSACILIVSTSALAQECVDLSGTYIYPQGPGVLYRVTQSGCESMTFESFSSTDGPIQVETYLADGIFRTPLPNVLVASEFIGQALKVTTLQPAGTSDDPSATTSLLTYTLDAAKNLVISVAIYRETADPIVATSTTLIRN
jgi:hypothetical protein